MYIVEFSEKCGLLREGVNETVENEVKEQKGRFFGMLDAMLAAASLGSALAGKRVVKGGNGVIQADDAVFRAGGRQVFNVAQSFK